MADKDDQDWTDTLAGKPPADADPLTVKEAKAVRQAMLERRERETPPEFDAESGLQRLLFRLRQERLEGPRAPAARRYAAFALAATVVLVAGLLLFLPKPGDDEPVYRGIERPQNLLADDPVKASDALKRDLEGLGLKPKITQRGNATLIEAPWPEKSDERHRALLERHYLRPPEGRTLSVEVRKRQ
jgi:hypothetical protein